MIKTVILIFIIAGVAVLIYMKKDNRFDKLTTSGEIKNSEMLAQEGVPTVSEEVAYFGEVRGLYVRPEAEGSYPGVVMIHENRGLRPEIRATAQQLAGQGYQVLAVNLLGGVVETQDEAKILAANFNQETAVANMRAAATYLRNHGAIKIASLGWCFGGKQSIELAISSEKLDATVVYYGGGMATTTDRLQPIKWPVLGIFGDKDQAIPVETVRVFEASLNTLGIQNEIHIYP
ncbi:MAG: dienelactone hydrolase family protein, partial [Candidatus Daviesbacteria bacterium]|nr:dienelactone hydrolase family protein [Candidatus Daviesbacteria bacterium]